MAKCKTCDGKGWVYEHIRYYLGARLIEFDGSMIDCPDCAQVKPCAVCGDYGVVSFEVTRDDPRFGKLFPCTACLKGRAMIQATADKALRISELPERYKSMTFGSWQRLPESARLGKELAATAARLFVSSVNFEFTLAELYGECGLSFSGEDHPANSLVLQGGVGVGKTGLAASICNYLLGETNLRPLYTHCRDLIRAVQESYKTADSDVLTRIKHAELLIVDEMNLSQPTPDRQDILEEVMRFRHGNALPTVITLNNDWLEFEKEWGIRTATAVREMSHWIAVGGAPIRNEGRVIREAS